MLYRKEREAWEQHLKDIRSAAKVKVAATVSEKLQQQQVQQQQQQLASAADQNSSGGASASAGAHSKASSAGKERADCITQELRREVYGTTENETEGESGADDSEGEGGSDSEGAAKAGASSKSKKNAGAKSGTAASISASDLVVLRKVESKPKSAAGRGKGPVSKADAVLSHVDIEVQVMDGEEGSHLSSSISVKGSKKRKLSKNGFITSHSMKHHSNEANKLVMAKKVRLGLAEDSTSSGNNGMFSSSTASSSVASGAAAGGAGGVKKSDSAGSSKGRGIFSGSVDLGSAGLGLGLGGEGKVRSIADVDRAMQRLQRTAKKSSK